MDSPKRSKPKPISAISAVAACRGFGIIPWPKQVELLEPLGDTRINVWALGRRSGKSTMAAVVGLWASLLRADLLRPLLRPGELGYAVAVANNQKQAGVIIRAARSIIEANPKLQALVVSDSNDEIIFRNRMAFAAFPCTSRGTRGWAIHTLVFDEFAHFFDTDGNSSAESIWAALAPSAAQFGEHGRIIASSTPGGEIGLFATLFQQAASGELPGAIAHQAATWDTNLQITAEFLATERVILGEDLYRQEYGAQFIGSGAAFLDPSLLRELTADRGELPPEGGLDWIAGLDPSFRSDPFGLAIVGRDRHEKSQLLVGLARNWPPMREAVSGEEQLARQHAVLDEVAAVCRFYGVSLAVTDQHLAPALVDYLQRKGLAVKVEHMNPTSKTAVYQALRARVNLRGIELYEQPQLIAELRRLRARHRAQSSQVENPRVAGSHGDMAQALALAVAEHDRFGLADLPAQVQREPLPEYTAGLADGEPGFVLGRRERQPSLVDMTF